MKTGGNWAQKKKEKTFVFVWTVRNNCGKGMKSRTELLAYANKQKAEGKFDIAEFIVNRGPRVVAEVLSTAWEMRSTQEKLQ